MASSQHCNHAKDGSDCAHSIEKERPSGFVTSTKLSILFSTLASSCCWIQIALNLFGFGCAGFSALNPYRALFTVPALMTLGFALFGKKTGLSSFSKLALTSIVALSLLGREIIQNHQYVSNYYHSNTVPPLSTPPQADTVAPPLTRSDAEILRLSMVLRDQESFVFRATGLGCEACNSDIRARVLSLPGMVSLEFTGLGDEALFYGVSSTYVSNTTLNEIVADRGSEIVILSRTYKKADLQFRYAPPKPDEFDGQERSEYPFSLNLLPDRFIPAIPELALDQKGVSQVELDFVRSKLIVEGTKESAPSVRDMIDSLEQTIVSEFTTRSKDREL